MQKPAIINSLSLKRIFTLSSIYGITPIIDRSIFLLLLPVFTRYLDTDAYGSMVLLYTCGGMLQIIASMGISDSLQKIYWDHEADRKACLGTAWVSILVLNTAIAIPLILFSDRISASLLSNGKLGFIFVFVVIRVGLATQMIVPYVIMRAQERKVAILTVNLLSIFFRVFLSLLFLVYFDLNVLGIILADVGSSIVVQFIYLPILRTEISITFKWAYVREFLRVSPFQLTVDILAWIINLSDRILIQHILCSSSQVAIYAVGYSFGSIILYLVNPIISAWKPYVYQVSASSPDEYRSQMGEFFGYFVIRCSFFLLVLMTVSTDVLNILTPPAYHGASGIIIVILIAQVMASISNYFISTFYITSAVNRVAGVYLVCALVNVALNFLLISWIGIMGAAISTLASYSIMAFALYMMSQQKIHIKFPYTIIGYSVIATVIMSAVLSKY